MINERLTNIVIGVITGAWAANFVAGLLPIDYTPDQAINGIFMGTVGILLAARARQSSNRKDDDDE